MLSKTKLQKLWKPTHKKIQYMQWSMHLVLIPAYIYGTLELFFLSMVMFWLIHGLGSGIGAHRFYTHNTFTTNKFWEVVMGFFYTIACTGSSVGYVLMHQSHHTNSDGDKDPHNPCHGILKTWFGLYNENNLKFRPKVYQRLMKNPIMAFFHNYYFIIIAAWVTLLALIDPILVIFMFCVPALMQFHSNAVLIVLAHTNKFGYRNFDTPDKSRNVWWLKPFLLGEELHNNHHHRPGNVSMKYKGWREFDPLYYVVKYVLATEMKPMSPFSKDTTIT